MPTKRTIEGVAGLSRTQATTLATALFWLCSFTVSTARSYLDRPDELLRLAVVRIGTTAIGFLFCYAIHRLWKLIESWPVRLRIVVLVAAVPVLADLYVWTVFAASSYAAAWHGSKASPSLQILNIVYWLWFFAAWTAVYLAIRYAYSAAQEARHSRQLEELAHKAQLRALRNQVNPHFLFNTLNSISGLILDRHTAEAERMVSNLADFFRATLAINPLDDLPLSDEVALQHLYLDIERVRFPDLSFSASIPPNSSDLLVPPLILQPLIENAVKHGVAKSSTPTRIELSAREQDGHLEIAVIDDGTAELGARRVGTGLSNVRDRLSMRYGEDCCFEARRLETGGFRVSFSIPAERP